MIPLIHIRWRQNRQNLSKRSLSHASISPIPRLHRNRQTPADSPLRQAQDTALGRRSTASEHEVPLVYSRIDLQPQALETHFLGFEIFKRYIERNVMERRLCWAYRLSH